MEQRTEATRVATRPGRSDDECSRRARALLAAASAARLVSESCPWGVDVDLAEQDSGRPVVVVEAGSPVEAALRRCPMATLVVPGPEGRAVHLVASYRAVRSERAGRRLFRPTLLFVHLVEGESRSVPVEVFQASTPYVAPKAQALVEHWSHHHQGELRAVLPDGAAVGAVLLATGLDRDALTVQALGAEGVTTHLVRHPAGTRDDPERQALAHGLPVGCRCA